MYIRMYVSTVHKIMHTVCVTVTAASKHSGTMSARAVKWLNPACVHVLPTHIPFGPV